MLFCGCENIMKIILSRKGFDSEAGGYPSPLFIEEKCHVSLPIPEDINGNAFDTGITYSDIYFKDANTYAAVMTGRLYLINLAPHNHIYQIKTTNKLYGDIFK